MRNEAYVPIKVGAPTPISNNGRSQTVLICEDWALTHFSHKSPLDIYDDCGIDQSAPCVDASGNIQPGTRLVRFIPIDLLFTGRNRYVCGDNKIYPSSLLSQADNGLPLYPNDTIEAFLNLDQVGVGINVILAYATILFSIHK